MSSLNQVKEAPVDIYCTPIRVLTKCKTRAEAPTLLLDRIVIISNGGEDQDHSRVSRHYVLQCQHHCVDRAAT